jgi:hypothetical protein
LILKEGDTTEGTPPKYAFRTKTETLGADGNVCCGLTALLAIFFFYNLFTKGTDKYIADTRLQERNQEKHMVFLALGYVGYMVALSVDVVL